MEIFGISACVICAVLFAAVVKKSNREYALLMTILTAILILLAVFQQVAPFLEEIEAIAQSESFDSGYLLVLLKAVGITLWDRQPPASVKMPENPRWHLP